MPLQAALHWQLVRADLDHEDLMNDSRELNG